LLGHLFVYKAYRHIEFSRVGLIHSLEPFIVTILAWMIFGDVLTPLQFAGGTLIVIGVWGLGARKSLEKQNKQKSHSGATR
jgi:drug/metabolite transporter (DMT)-like permease